jgi:hypothetical protein
MKSVKFMARGLVTERIFSLVYVVQAEAELMFKMQQLGGASMCLLCVICVITKRLSTACCGIKKLNHATFHIEYSAHFMLLELELRH